MELTSVRVVPSPTDGGRIRLVGEVAYDDRPGTGPESYWFDVPEEHAGALSQTGNPWLVCLVPLAVKLGEPLRLCLPVDRLLARNVEELMAVWRAWYPELHRVEVIAKRVEDLPQARGPRSGSFFSTGVDSFFTLLRSMEPGEIPVDDLVTVWGFDLPLSDTAAFASRKARMEAIGKELGKTLVDVSTNLRRTRLSEAKWGPLWHGCGLAAVGLALEGRYRRLLIGSAFDYAHVVPWGTHPLTDPLLSTARTDFLHDGATHDRFQKLEYVSRFAVALRNLHVCFRQASDENCGACEKCLRTMAILEVLGRLGPGTRFPGARLDPARLARVYVSLAYNDDYYRRIRAEAAARGKDDIARAASRVLGRSRVIRRLMSIPDWLNRKTALWRAAGPIRRALTAGTIR